jgi:peptidoglycan/LPS O-acetylase OafA/YrhL
MRGLAAFFVYIRHFGAIHHPDIQPGFGSSPENRYIIQLPFLRLLVSGPAMVALFFIISGYALSWGPLKVLHQGARDQCAQRLSSATFRRAMRLYLPGIASTFVIMICISLGMYDWGQKAWESNVDVPGFHEPQPPQFRRDPFATQFWNWVLCSWRWINIWSVTGHEYNPHLWTLSVEFRCSIALFMALLALARTKTIYRLAGLASFVVYCYYTNSWPEWLFFAGATLAQLRLIQLDREADLGVKLEEDAESDDGSNRCPITPADIGRFVLFTAGLYLLSAPDYGHCKTTPFSITSQTLTPPAAAAPGYITLSGLIPSAWPESWRFLHCVGGALTVYSVSSTRTHALRAIFDNAYSRYLGKISYALYLVHGPIVHMLGFWLVPFFWKYTGRDTMFGKELGWAMAFCVLTPLIVYTADVFWRQIDVRCVALAKWLENFVQEKN